MLDTTEDRKMLETIVRGELTPDAAIWGYMRGIFPMGEPESDRIEWFCPDPRAIIDLEQFHISKTLANVIRRGKFDIFINRDFSAVIHACSRRPETWITPRIIECYSRLHEMGFAHSVETWFEGQLAGGLYGVAIGGAFFGESMFHDKTDASKVALAGLVHQLRKQKFVLLDTQYQTAHLAKFSTITISHSDYLSRLQKALCLNRVFQPAGQTGIHITPSSL
jgi:leucyl/phenylalanyl-tRNA--protein transferase